MPLGPEAHGGLDGLAHGAPEGHPLLQLHGDGLAHQLSLDLRLVDLQDVDEHVALGALADLLLEAIHLRALPADDDAGPRGEDVHLQLVGRPLDLDGGDPGAPQPALEVGPQAKVLVQQLGVLLLRVPAGPPGLVEPDAEPVRMDLLSHQRPPTLWSSSIVT
jgi:hypothetical protein